MARSVSEYTRKRNFDVTPEPPEEQGARPKHANALRFVIQKHDARALHYDFRLEINGTLKSWAIPKGPSLDPKHKRLAVHVEDHPLSYANFEGHIPEGHYGGGDVIVWDRGIWTPIGDATKSYESGKLKFALVGEKLAGHWTLVRTHLRGSGNKEQWLLIKERDESARSADEYDVVTALPKSVISDAEIDSRKKNKSHKTDSTKSTAKKTALPAMISPQLATLVSEPPAGDWLYEIKFDGYRILSRIEKNKVQLITRNGHEWTERLPVQAKAIAELGLDDTWLDGEVVVLNENGIPDFQALQRAFDIGRSHHIVYYLFDVPFLNGVDMRDLPVEERRAALKKIIPAKTKTPLRFSAAFMENHHSVLESACAMSLEGVIGKRVGSPYVSRRSQDWIKLKCRLRQEFVIVGFSKPKGSRTGFGALLLGVYARQGSHELLYAGRVGTGFNEAVLKQLHEKLQKLEAKTSPLNKSLPASLRHDVHWVKPSLVCEVEFAEWTADGVLRHATFIAQRTDKPAHDIIRERPKSLYKDALKNEDGEMADGSGSPTSESRKKKPAPSKKKNARGESSDNVADIKITHPERVIDKDSGITKLELAQFYEHVSAALLPHIHDRPVSLLRAPTGIGGQQFFQKHAENLAIPHMHHLDPALDVGHASLMQIDSVQAVVSSVQMGAIELHTWGSTSDAIEMPDRIVFDLDPDPALPWRSVVEAAQLVLAVLDELELRAFLKTTGGKGLHIVVPIAPQFDWDYIKNFSKAVSQFIAKQVPERFVAKMGPQNRIGKIFIDYLRNQRGASTVAAYSVRARPGLPVSVPIALTELKTLKSSAQWHVGNLHERLAKLKKDPWQGYSHQQKITSPMWKKLGAKVPTK
ncbi:MAG TPA: DNA ligase D [Cellvibrio sp.]|nr:DNA ligase D [Cellvibrio sp.]